MSKFSPNDRARLLKLNGVGPTVIQRFEQLDIADLPTLADQDPVQLCRQIAKLLASTCWQNSPQAQAAVLAAIQEARRLQTE